MICPVITEPKKDTAALGWDVREIDGHNEDLIKTLTVKSDKPLFIVANTIKGKGVSFMENVPKWHSTWLGGDWLSQAREELS